MYKIPRQSYTAEFKQEAVRQVESEGKPQAQIARELGISEQTLANWRKAHKAGKLTGDYIWRQSRKLAPGQLRPLRTPAVQR